MLNEIQEFLDYTTPVKYTAETKSDTTYLRHFTLDFFTSFDGLNRVLTIIARGYLFHNGEPDIDRAKRALLAWSSIPESKKTTPKEEWQYKTDFRELHEEFPELVDKNGKGWLHRYAHRVEKFILKNAEQIDSRKVPQAEKIRKTFDAQWRTKVEQLQNSIFNSNTKGGWVFRFDDAIAEALELGPLQNYEITLPEELKQRVVQATSAKAALYVCDLISYYLAHRWDDTDWVVLPATSFDNYYCSSYFSKRCWAKSQNRSWFGRSGPASPGTISRKNSCHKFVTLATCNSPFSKVTSPKTFGRRYLENLFGSNKISY